MTSSLVSECRPKDKRIFAGFYFSGLSYPRQLERMHFCAALLHPLSPSYSYSPEFRPGLQQEDRAVVKKTDEGEKRGGVYVIFFTISASAMYKPATKKHTLEQLQGSQCLQVLITKYHLPPLVPRDDPFPKLPSCLHS